MHCKTRAHWPFPGLFSDFWVILTSGGYLLKITFKDSWGKGRTQAPTESLPLLPKRLQN